MGQAPSPMHVKTRNHIRVRFVKTSLGLHLLDVKRFVRGLRKDFETRYRSTPTSKIEKAVKSYLSDSFCNAASVD